MNKGLYIFLELKSYFLLSLVFLFCTYSIDAQNYKYEKLESYKYNMDYIDALINKSDFYFISGNAEKAIQIEKEKTDILVYLLDNESNNDNIYDWYKLEYIKSLKTLATLFNKIGDLDNRSLYCNMHTEYCKKFYGKTSKEYIEALSFQAFYYYNSGNYRKAIELENEALLIQENENIIDSTAYAISHRNMAIYNREIGNINIALNYIDKSIAFFQNDKRNRLYGSAMSEKANCHMLLGNYNEAKEILNELLLESKNNISYDYSYFLLLLANCHFSAGEYNEAIRLYIETLGYENNSPDKNILKIASIYDNLAMSYAGLKQYREAIKSMERCVEIEREVFGEDNIKYARSLINLGYIYRCVGDDEMAANNHEKALSILEKEKENILYVEALCYTFWDYIYSDPNHALDIALEAYNCIKLFDSQINNTHFMCLKNLIYAYIGVGEFDKAKEIIEVDSESYELKKYLEDNQSDYFEFLKIKSEFYHTLKEYKKAVDIEKQVLSSVDINNSHFDISYINLLKNYLALEDTSNIIKLINEYDFAGKVFKKAYSNIVSLTSKFRQSYWDVYSKFADLLPLLAYLTDNRKIISMAYDFSALFAKGMLLREDLKLSNAIRKSKNTTLQEKYKLYQENLAKLNKSNIDNQVSDSLFKIITIQEDEVKQMVLSKNTIDMTFVSWKDVQGCLRNNDIAIEYLSFPWGVDDHYYIALVVKKGYSYPHLYKLFAESELDSLLSTPNRNTYKIYKLIWEPIESELIDIENVYFSPSGRLYNIGVEYLPNELGNTVFDDYNVFRLSSTQELLNKPINESIQNAVLYGGLDYDVNPSVLESELHDMNNKDYINVLRGGLRDALCQRGGFEPLFNSSYEIKDITKILLDNNISCQTYDGIHGTEESFKNLSEQSINILHIATHGMYIGQNEKENETNKFFSFILPDDKTESTSEDIALTRSFLVMSGGDMLPHRHVIPDGIEDGIITAEEISRMEFKNLNLVVLSACQTGLGDLSKEGVLGLQRGFKKAGANTILMSLCKVDDEATKILMIEFYKNLMNGKSKFQSLKNAQKYLRKVENCKYDKPEYWASFIMLDGLN